MRHVDALAQSLEGGKASLDGRHSALVELCKTLAGQMDAAGDEPSTRLTAAYLSALKDLARVVGAVKPHKANGRLAELRAGSHQTGDRP